MQVLDPGHEYICASLDGDAPQRLSFVKREGPGYPGNVGHHAGTNLQEVLRVLINRVEYLDGQIRDSDNAETLFHLRSAIYHLENRAARRHGRFLPGAASRQAFMGIETLPTCGACGHIGCDGDCHP